jgi:outer membrane protein assembly factor BamB
MTPRSFQLIAKLLHWSEDLRVLLWMTFVTVPLLTACGTGSTQAVPTAVNTLFATNPPSANSLTKVGEDWPTYHRDNTRTGYLPDMPDPRQLTVAWNTPLDGAVYAEPLVVSGHIIVATENNSLYSLNTNTGQVEWQTRIGDPVPGLRKY